MQCLISRDVPKSFNDMVWPPTTIPGEGVDSSESKRLWIY